MQLKMMVKSRECYTRVKWKTTKKNSAGIIVEKAFMAERAHEVRDLDIIVTVSL
jgi:hypothetical protein